MTREGDRDKVGFCETTNCEWWEEIIAVSEAHVCTRFYQARLRGGGQAARDRERGIGC